jgi:hypothetical protein
VADTNLLLATTAHVYPDVTSWNSSVALANDVTSRIPAGREDQPAVAEAAR